MFMLMSSQGSDCSQWQIHMHQIEVPHGTAASWPAPQFRESFFCGTASWLTGSSTWSCLPCKMHRWSARWLSSQCPLTASSGLEVHTPRSFIHSCCPCQNLFPSVKFLVHSKLHFTQGCAADSWSYSSVIRSHLFMVVFGDGLENQRFWSWMEQL